MLAETKAYSRNVGSRPRKLCSNDILELSKNIALMRASCSKRLHIPVAALLHCAPCLVPPGSTRSEKGEATREARGAPSNSAHWPHELGDHRTQTRPSVQLSKPHAH